MNFELLMAGAAAQLLALPFIKKAEAAARIAMICGAVSVLCHAVFNRDFTLFTGQLLITLVALKK